MTIQLKLTYGSNCPTKSGTNSGKSIVVVWKNLPQGIPKFRKILPKRRSPERKFDDLKEFFWATNKDFSLFVRLLDLNSEEYKAHSYPGFNSEHIPVNPIVNPMYSLKSRLHRSNSNVWTFGQLEPLCQGNRTTLDCNSVVPIL